MARGTGFAATVFSPPSSPPDRCALVLGGSGGATAWSWQVAALFASRGHRAAAVAYFDWSGQPGLPRSITGPEMRDWKQVRLDAGIDVFFCDPHAPWQRGSNENTNGLLRQYFPKCTDFAAVSEAQLDAVAEELNDRPRKRLGFAKPTEGSQSYFALTARIRRSSFGT